MFSVAQAFLFGFARAAQQLVRGEYTDRCIIERYQLSGARIARADATAVSTNGFDRINDTEFDLPPVA
jgi:hypothetical protein